MYINNKSYGIYGLGNNNKEEIRIIEMSHARFILLPKLHQNNIECIKAALLYEFNPV